MTENHGKRSNNLSQLQGNDYMDEDGISTENGNIKDSQNDR